MVLGPDAVRAAAAAGRLAGPAAGDGRGPGVPLPSGRAPDEWVGLDGYYAGETLRLHRHADGSPSHLDLATFIFTRTPYDPKAPIPGGLDERGWHPGE